MRISDWSSDVCSSDLIDAPRPDCWVVRFTDSTGQRRSLALYLPRVAKPPRNLARPIYLLLILLSSAGLAIVVARFVAKPLRRLERAAEAFRSEEPTSELQSLMRISYAVFCLKKKQHINTARNTEERLAH